MVVGTVDLLSFGDLMIAIDRQEANSVFLKSRKPILLTGKEDFMCRPTFVSRLLSGRLYLTPVLRGFYKLRCRPLRRTPTERPAMDYDLR